MAKKIILTETQFKQWCKYQLLQEGALDNYIKRMIRNNCDESFVPYLDKPANLFPYPVYMKEFCPGVYEKCKENGSTLMQCFRFFFMRTFELDYGASPIAYAKGLARISCEEYGLFTVERDSKKIIKLSECVNFLVKHPHAVKTTFDRDLNGISGDDFIAYITQCKKEKDAEQRKEQGKMESKYTIVKIESFAEAREYAPYTSWCVTNDPTAFSTYTAHGSCFYFCYVDNFKDIKKTVDENTPLDEYGLSLTSVNVSANGEPRYITTRWNHEHDGENNPQFKTKEQVESIIGVDFDKTFVPFTSDVTQLSLFHIADLLQNGAPFRYFFKGPLYENKAWALFENRRGGGFTAYSKYWKKFAYGATLYGNYHIVGKNYIALQSPLSEPEEDEYDEYGDEETDEPLDYYPDLLLTPQGIGTLKYLLTYRKIQSGEVVRCNKGASSDSYTLVFFNGNDKPLVLPLDARATAPFGNHYFMEDNKQTVAVDIHGNILKTFPGAMLGCYTDKALKLCFFNELGGERLYIDPVTFENLYPDPRIVDIAHTPLEFFRNPNNVNVYARFKDGSFYVIDKDCRIIGGPYSRVAENQDYASQYIKFKQKNSLKQDVYKMDTFDYVETI